MDSGFYAACAGLRAQSEALEVAAHNLANLNTAGFRGQQTTFQSLLAVSRPTVPNVLNLATNNFGVLEGSRLDMTAGNLEATGNQLDAGIVHGLQEQVRQLRSEEVGHAVGTPAHPITSRIWGSQPVR